MLAALMDALHSAGEAVWPGRRLMLAALIILGVAYGLAAVRGPAPAAQVRTTMLVVTPENPRSTP